MTQAIRSKRCIWCLRVKVARMFHRRGKQDLQSACKLCIAAYQLNYYKRTKRRRTLQAVKWKRDRKRLARSELVLSLRDHPCVDCGERDIVVLDFDHVYGRKSAAISMLVQSGRRWSDILPEIQKCQGVCANCHRRRTARRGEGWNVQVTGACSVNSSIADS